MMLMGIRAVRVVRDRFRGGEDESSSLDALGADQPIGEFTNRLGGASKQDDFEAALPTIAEGSVASHEYTQDDAIAAIKANMK